MNTIPLQDEPENCQDMNRSEAKQRILDMVVELTRREELRHLPEDEPLSLAMGLDSITMWEFALRVEREFGIQVPPEEMLDEFANLGALLDLLERQSAGCADPAARE